MSRPRSFIAKHPQPEPSAPLLSRVSLQVLVIRLTCIATHSVAALIANARCETLHHSIIGQVPKTRK
ncbi:hypothetical protein PAXRUDRAFT_830870 [Paxillus rubicundulus Ve08.2h10]|uniref:Uncharacterized protein n=1 Tax=Paxillus rubicundulus Ve08.2h10 TaxID=930991 RepID=A0A0D0DSV9_9AGAM|nr:hypothetical protein PAXRUDRAFT_830870 [Paxillus rubicundulus Ve08.2h10]